MNAAVPTPTFLLDSSVLVKWIYREEEDADIALHIQEGFLREQWEIRLADVSFYELANALHYLGEYTPEQIVEGVQSLFAMELTIYGFDLLVLRAALDLCVEKNISIYDAYLVALAKRENLIFITADDKLLRKLGKGTPALALRDFPIKKDDRKKTKDN